MGDGRKTLAPCGHMGEVVIGTYVQCNRCDRGAVPKHVVPEKTEPMFSAVPRCPSCWSESVTHFKYAMDGLGWALAGTGRDMPSDGQWGCWACGYLWG